MIVYAGVLTIIAVFGMSSLVVPFRTRFVVSTASVLILIPFMGLRDYVSADWPMYVRIFDTYSTLPWQDARVAFPTEFGFGLLNKAVGALGSDEHLVALICAAIMVSGILYLAVQTKVPASFALFVACPYLLFVVGMGYTRQSVAIGLSFASIPFYLRRDWWKFGILTLFAILFHNSAIVMIGVMFCDTWKKLLGGALIGIPVLLYSGLVSEGGRYSGYVQEGGGAVQASGVLMRIAIVGVGFAAIYIQRRQWRVRDPQLLRLFWRAALLLLILAPFSSLASSMVDRFTLYLFFALVVGLGASIEMSLPKFRWVWLIAIYTFSYATFLTWFLTSSFARWYWTPYAWALPKF